MSTISFILVVLVALVVGMASVLDERQFYRPLVACQGEEILDGSLRRGLTAGMPAHTVSHDEAGGRCDVGVLIVEPHHPAI